MKTTIDGNTLKRWGFEPGRGFAQAIEAANGMRDDGHDDDYIMRILNTMDLNPPPTMDLKPLRPGSGYTLNIEAEMEGDADNIAKVCAHMDEIMRLPVVKAGAVMPDACPSDPRPGFIPVGGVVASTEIHPGMHSADICCSMAATVFPADTNPTAILDAGMKLSHFGWGGRDRESQLRMSNDLLNALERNRFLEPTMPDARKHFGTQGDGNHFFYVGRRASDGCVVLVTHHGSRKPGALLYKAGMKVAEKIRRAVCPQAAQHNAWIVADSRDGEDYWNALQTIRDWTKANHFAIHDLVADALGLRRMDRFWNEHNYVFRKKDGLFYHAKGATPAFAGYADDADGRTLIPLNMAEPILVAEGLDAPGALGFAPHGAGRNLSRRAFMTANAGKTTEAMFAEQAPGIDARAYSGVQDPSELPGAYKSAAMVRRQIDKFGLAKIIDTIEPIGSIMAGEQDEPWRKRRVQKKGASSSAHLGGLPPDE